MPYGAMHRTTRALIVINFLTFLVELLIPDLLISYFALWPLGSTSALEGVRGFLPWQLVTYSFLHGSLIHLLFNMYALYMFGGELEMLFGARRFLNLYFASVISAAITQLGFSMLSGSFHPTLGASGGVFGLLLAYGAYFPRRTIVLLIPPIPLSAKTFVIFYGLLELFLGITGTQEGVAHFAHLGGMVGAWLMMRRWRGRPPFRMQ
jgi:membrane associated rhomboid family serine protease